MSKSIIGNTPLEQIPELCEAYELPNLWIKAENHNPTGTMKDRRSRLVVAHLEKMDPERRGHVCLVTAGNSALSIREISNGMHLAITALVSPDIDPEVAEAMLARDIRVVPTSLKYPLTSHQIQQLAKRSEDDTPLDISSMMHNAYSVLIEEIETQTEKPDYIVAPYGTGEALYGMARWIYRSQSHSPHHVAQLIGVRPSRPHGSLADKLDGTVRPYGQWLREFRKEGFRESRVNEKEIERAFQTVSPFLHVEPSSAAPFAALKKLKFKPQDKVVVINSGRGIYPHQAPAPKFQPEALM